MVRDLVPFPDGAFENLRMIGGILTDNEKGRLEMPGRQQVEQLRRQRRVGSVIKSQRDVRAIDVDRTEGNRWFRGCRRGLWFDRRGARFLYRNGRLRLLGKGDLVDQENDCAKDDKSRKKHENEGESENLRLSSRADLQRKRRRGADSPTKRPKSPGQTNVISIKVSRHNPQLWQLSCSKHRHDSLRLREVSPGCVVRPGRHVDTGFS